MHYLAYFSLYLLLLISHVPSLVGAVATISNLERQHHTRRRLPKLVRRVQSRAADQTRSFARDIRTAFRAVLPRALDDSYRNDRVVYCKIGSQGIFPVDKPSSGSNSDDDLPKGDPQSDSELDPLNNTPAAFSSSSIRPRTRTSTGAQPTPTVDSRPSSPWRLTNTYQGQSFFNEWDFFTAEDPTRGIVDYINEGAGRQAGILEVNSAGNAIMRVETTPTVANNRRSIRITTRTVFTGGLVILDAVHMPVGCGTWPAFWTNGPDWPNGGEIDILEGVHEYANNQATLHTAAGCEIASTSSDALGITGRVIAGTNCDVGRTSNQGCGIRATTPLSYGRGFNENRGGVYAMRWDDSGISIYFFPRGSIPDDIEAEEPRPDTWGAAQARWPARSCDPFQFFNNHHIIFDTTLCGDWAGAVWNSAGIPGQEQSCAERTGVSTCEEYVRRNGAAFAEAYWEVRSVKIYRPR